jgi:hypothetical protein
MIVLVLTWRPVGFVVRGYTPWPPQGGNNRMLKVRNNRILKIRITRMLRGIGFFQISNHMYRK